MEHIYIDYEQRVVEFFNTKDREPSRIGEVIVAPEICIEDVSRYNGKHQRTSDSVGIEFLKQQIMQSGEIISLDAEKNLDDYFWSHADFEQNAICDNERQWKRYKLWKIRATPEKLCFYFFDKNLEGIKVSNGAASTNATIVLPNTVGLSVMASVAWNAPLSTHTMLMYYYPCDKNQHRCDANFTRYPAPIDEITFGWCTNLK